jgi:uncharacterized DUF497 family protein
LDFKDASEVFDGQTYDRSDKRFEYHEERVVTIGHLKDRMVVVAGTQAEDARHVISISKANQREQKRYSERFEKG